MKYSGYIFWSFINVLAFLFVGLMKSFAQEAPDTNLFLPLIEVYAKQTAGYENGIKIEKVDSITLKTLSSATLSDLIERNTIMYSKNFGPGNLSTLSFRGATSSQSGVYWNGFDIKPPGAGMIDLSLIPLFFFNRLDIQYGGTASVDGSGVMGGALYLGNTALTGTPDEISGGINVGSFEEMQQFASLRLSRSTWGSSTAIYHKQAENNFRYRAFGENSVRKNASVLMNSLMQNVEKQWKNYYLNFGLWALSSEREIPASVTSADLNASRQDKSLKITARLNKSTKNAHWKSGIAFFHDYLRYKEAPGDTLILLDSRILNSSVLADFSYETEIPYTNILLYSGIYVNKQWIDINDFGGEQQQSQLRACMRFTRPFFKDRWRVSVSLSKEAVSGYYIPLSPSLSIEGRILKNFYSRIYYSQNHRIPSMNDRFWQPGGNENLQAETGKHSGGGLTWILLQTENANLQLSGDAYYSDITDCISWIPSASGYFVARNFQKVEIKGAEIKANISILLREGKISIQSSLTQLSAVNKRRLNNYDVSEGKQLIYTPKQKLSGLISVTWKSLLLSYDQSYTGKTFTDRENTESVDSYTRADITLGYHYSVTAKLNVECNLEVKNLWDTDYEVVKYYPMPGRSFMIGLVGKFGGKK